MNFSKDQMIAVIENPTSSDTTIFISRNHAVTVTDDRIEPLDAVTLLSELRVLGPVNRDNIFKFLNDHVSDDAMVCLTPVHRTTLLSIGYKADTMDVHATLARDGHVIEHIFTCKPRAGVLRHELLEKAGLLKNNSSEEFVKCAAAMRVNVNFHYDALQGTTFFVQGDKMYRYDNLEALIWSDEHAM